MMTHEAATLVGNLVTLTNGWTDASVDALIDRITREWPDPRLGAVAVEEVLTTWRSLSRPNWAVLDQAYRSARRRADMDHSAEMSDPNPMALPSGLANNPNRIVPPKQGLQIAYKAYCSEVRSQGRKPRPFKEFAGMVPVVREHRPHVRW